MPGTPGKGGGKRPGAGRKAGAAWAPRRPKELSKLARATTLEVLKTGRDPLLTLLELGEDLSLPPDTRIRALAAAMPYCRPRLSMVVTADATPKQDDKPTQDQMIAKLSAMLDRMALARPATIEAKVIEDEPAKDHTENPS